MVFYGSFYRNKNVEVLIQKQNNEEQIPKESEYTINMNI